MSIKIYKDNSANAIFIEDANGSQFLNSLNATSQGNFITINDTSRTIQIISNVLFSEFIDKDNIAYGSDSSTTATALNEVFNSSATNTMDVFFAELNSSFISTTSYQDVDFGTPKRIDTGFTFIDGSSEITLSEGDYDIQYGVLGNQATANNRVESQIRLLLDGVEYGFDANYSQRNNVQDTGGVNSFYLLTNVTEGQKLKLQTRHVGSVNTIIQARIYIKKIY